MAALLGLVAAVSLVLILVSRGRGIGGAMVAGALVAGLAAGLDGRTVVTLLGKAAVAPATLELAAVIVFIWILGRVLQATGALQQVIDALAALFRDPRYVAFLGPSLIGLLNVPGGAILSAPVVGAVGKRYGLSPEQNTAINIVFRHIWYPAYPLYPPLILLSRLSDTPIDRIIPLAAIAVVPAVAVAGSLILFRRSHQPLPAPGPTGGRQSAFPAAAGERLPALFQLWRGLAPVVVAVGLAGVFRTPLILSVGAGVVLALVSGLDRGRGYGQAWAQFRWRVRRFVLKDIPWEPAFMVFGVMAFRQVVVAAGGMETLARSLADAGVPLWLIVSLLPFLVSLVTGSNLAGVGVSVPVLLPLMTVAGKAVPAGVFLLLMGTLGGYYLSPLHLCLILSRQYFGASFWPAYRLLLPPVGVLMGVSLLVAWQAW